jgi:hypothetical protein
MLVAGCHKRHEGFTRMAHCDDRQAFLSGGCIMFGNELLKPGPRLIQIPLTQPTYTGERMPSANTRNASRSASILTSRQPAPIRSHGVMEM